MSPDCPPMATITPQEAPSKPFSDESYPILRIRSRTIRLMSTYPVVVTSPATTTRPVVSRVSTATRLWASCRIIASRTESLIWSAILSGCPSVTDSEVKRRPVTCLLLLVHRAWIGGHDSGQSRCRDPPVNAWSAGPGPVESGDDLVPHCVREGRLRAGRYVAGAAVGAEDHGLVVLGPEHGSAAYVVHDEEVAALAGELGPAEVEHGA